MAYKIIWSPEAKDTFEEIIEYLLHRFTEKEASRFVRIVNRRLLLLQHAPKTFRLTAPTSKRRRTVIHKRALKYYSVRVRKYEVELLYFFNTRQNPSKTRH